MPKRRTFSREFKLAAVKKIIEQGLSYAAVAKDLSIGETLLCDLLLQADRGRP